MNEVKEDSQVFDFDDGTEGGTMGLDGAYLKPMFSWVLGATFKGTQPLDAH